MAIAPASEACPMGDNHVTKPWVGHRRRGLSCRKCHKTWEFINVTPAHVRMKASHDITEREHDNHWNMCKAAV